MKVVLFHARVAFRRELYAFSFVFCDFCFEPLGRVGAVDEAQGYERLGVAAGGHSLHRAAAASARRRLRVGVAHSLGRGRLELCGKRDGDSEVAQRSPAGPQELNERTHEK